MTHDHDHDLRERFAALRDEETSRAPDFDATVRAARKTGGTSRSRPAAWKVAAAAAIVIATGVALVAERERVTTSVIAPSAKPGAAGGAAPTTAARPVLWRGPTDFLLEMPDSDLLGTIPALGGKGGWNLTPPTRAPSISDSGRHRSASS